MRKKLLTCMLIITLLLTGCSEMKPTHENSVPDYFLEPEGYTIVMIDNGKFIEPYGYITNDDLQAYKDGDSDYVIYVQNAFTENKGEYVTVSSIRGMNVGYYVSSNMKHIYE